MVTSTRSSRVGLAAAVAGVLAGAAWWGSGRAQPRTWDLVAPASLTLQVGQVATLEVAVPPGPGRTWAREPFRLDVVEDDAAGPGLDFKRRRWERGHAVDPDASAPRFAISLRAAALGSHEVELALLAWSCQARTCKPVRTSRTVRVEVVAPPSPDAAPAPPDAAPMPPDAPARRPRTRAR